MILSDTAIRRPVSTALLTMVSLVFGYLAFMNIGVDLFPEVEFPTVTVLAVLPGADPEIIDSEVTDVLEEQINTIEGIKNIISFSREGQAQIVAEFELSKDVDIAAQEVRDKVNIAQADLPRDLEPPLIQKLDLAGQPIMWVSVTSSGGYAEMARYAEDVLKERLQTIPGVGAVVMGGFRDRAIRIWLNPAKLESRNLTPLDVAAAVRAKHVKMPGGRIEQEEWEYVVKVEGEYQSVEELEDLVIKAEAGGLVRIRDVARVEDGLEDLRAIARSDGRPTVGLGIRKQSGANTVAVADAVKTVVADMARQAPGGIHVAADYDSSRFVRNSMNDVIFDLFLGAVLTSLVILFFLRSVRMTLISAVAVPTSIVTSFVAMYALDFTVNNMTMLAMSLAIGMVIDDAIVVLENIFRHLSRGEKARHAARQGTSEVGLAVIATTMSIVAVFGPVAFMKGVIGRFFFQFGLSVALAVVISTLVALTVIPMLCSRFLGSAGSSNRGLFRYSERFFDELLRIYEALLDKVLNRPWRTIGVAALVFVFGLALIPFVDKQFFTQPDESQFVVRFEFPTGTSIERSDKELKRVENLVFSQTEVRGAFSAIGFEGAVNSGVLFVNLTPPGDRGASQAEVMSRLRVLLRQELPSANIAVENSSIVGGGFRNADLQFVVQGPDVGRLGEVSEQMMERMRGLPGFVDIDNNLRLNKPEFQITIKREYADDLGVDVQSISQNFNILFGGMDVARFTDEGRRYDIRLKADPDSRATPLDLYRVSLRSSTGRMVETANLLEVEPELGPASINRYNRSRSVTVFANLEGVPLGEALNIMNSTAEELVPKEPGWSTALAGSSETFTESFRYFMYAIVIALFLIYAILGSQFESFVHPFTILMSVPLAVVGGIGLLILTGMSLDIFSFIGFVMLIGIVTKNAILLVDITNQQRAAGLSLEEALRRSGPLRLRPILMTALTTMAAVTPVALALSEGGEQRAPMAVAVIGGLATSTFLTLLVIPCVYLEMDRLSVRVGGKLKQWIEGTTGASTPTEPGSQES